MPGAVSEDGYSRLERAFLCPGSVSQGSPSCPKASLTPLCSTPRKGR